MCLCTVCLSHTILLSLTSSYGLAPNYGCCTANFNQGWPKLVQNAVMITPDNSTLVFAVLAPLTVTLGETTLTVDTDYPFGETGTGRDYNVTLTS